MFAASFYSVYCSLLLDASLLYAFGDVKDPLPETAMTLMELCTDYILEKVL